MILDERTEFVDAVAVPLTLNANVLLGDVIDLGGAVNVGSGDYCDFYVSVDTAITGATSVEFKLVSDAQPAIDPATGTLHGSTGAIPVARLTAGALFSFQLPKSFDYERYLGLVVTVVGTATAGKINSGLAAESAGWKAVASETGY
jgi:hypothetical protein